MKIRVYIFLFVLFTFSCKKVQKENKTIVTKNIVSNSEKKDTSKVSSLFVSKLPIGDRNLISDRLKGNNVNEKIVNAIFKYYDTIDGVASPIFKPLNIELYNSFYKPSKADTINELDTFILQSETRHSFFKLVKILPSKNEYTPMIFEGRLSKQDYDGNVFFVNRKDLVIVSNKNNIIDEMNLYYDYNDGINVKTKLFFIDEDYKIYIRYYNENEEGKSKFSNIETFQILNNGIIENESK